MKKIVLSKLICKYNVKSKQLSKQDLKIYYISYII